MDLSTETATARARAFLTDYRDVISQHLETVRSTSADAILRAGTAVAQKVAESGVVYVYGPGAHSTLAAQEIFFRAGGLANISAILDDGTLMSSGALRSMAIERLPGYGRIVIDDNRLGVGDLLILVNAYGINAVVIDATMRAHELGATVIGVSSRLHAESTTADHPARHPSKANLHDIVDIHVDTCIPVGDAVMQHEAVEQRFAPISTFAGAFALNSIVSCAIILLAEAGIAPPVLRSGNAPGGDDVTKRLLAPLRDRMRWL